MTRNVRLPLPPSVVRDDVTNAVYKLNLDVNNFIEPTHERPLEAIYNVPFKNTFVHYIDDERLGVAYLTFTGEDTEDLIARMKERVPTLSLADVDRMLDEADDETALRRALGSAFLLAPESFDPTFMKYFERAFRHPSADVRGYGVLGVGYTGWPELAESLRELAANDPDSDVRAYAASMLDAMSRLQKEKK